MSTRSAQHDTFTIERTYPVSPSRVYHAFSDPGAKARWFGCVPDWVVAEQTSDFRVGGHEIWRVGPAGGTEHRNDTYYHDLVPDERIVWSYTMSLDGRRISVSLATVELHREGSGTRFELTEQGIFLDGYDGAEERVHGTQILLDNLGKTFDVTP